VITAELQGEAIYLDSQYYDRAKIQGIPGARFDRNVSKWYVPATHAHCLILRELIGPQLQLGQELVKWAGPVMKRADTAMAIRSMMSYPSETIDFVEAHYNKQIDADLHLFEYQRADAAFMAFNADWAILGNDPGMGKTISTIRALQLRAFTSDMPLPALIICPMGAIRVWRDALEKWWPAVKVRPVFGTATKRRKQFEEEADIYIVAWQNVAKHSRIAGYGSERLKRCEQCGGLPNPPEGEEYKAAVTETQCQVHERELNKLDLVTVIADEAHRMKNPKALQTRATWAVMDSAKTRWALTGTPIANNIGDLWGILRGCDQRSFPVYTKFLDLFATITRNFFGGAEILEMKPEHKALFYKIFDPHFRRIPKKLALPQLPDMVETYRYVEMRPEQAKQYKQMVKHQIANIDGEILSAGNPLEVLTRLKMFANATCELGPDNEVIMKEPSGKLDGFMDYLEDRGDDPLVVVGERKQLLYLAAKRLQRAGVSHAIITGDQAIYERDSAVSNFQAGHLRVILLALGTGAEAITLTRADTIVFLDESYSQLKNLQANGRVDRIGAECHTGLQRVVFVTEGTIEDDRRGKLIGKENRLKEVTRDAESLAKFMEGKE
jgi:SNF2 family DNA or RNA helicase